MKIVLIATCLLKLPGPLLCCCGHQIHRCLLISARILSAFTGKKQKNLLIRRKLSAISCKRRIIFSSLFTDKRRVIFSCRRCLCFVQTKYFVLESFPDSGSLLLPVQHFLRAANAASGKQIGWYNWPDHLLARHQNNTADENLLPGKCPGNPPALIIFLPALPVQGNHQKF